MINATGIGFTIRNALLNVLPYNIPINTRRPENSAQAHHRQKLYDPLYKDKITVAYSMAQTSSAIKANEDIERSRKKIQAASGIDVSNETLDKNFAKLKSQVQGTDGLTKAEKRFVDIMAHCDWHLQHVSEHGKEIITEGKIMSGAALAEHELGRAQYTNDIAGKTCLVFFSIAPQEQVPIPNFLNNDPENKTIFTFPYKNVVKEWPDAMLSDHWYAFVNQQNLPPVRIGNTIIKTRYRFSEGIAGGIKYTDIIDLKTNSKSTIKTPIHNGLFKLKDAKQALALQLIQILRACDKETYDDFFSAKSLSNANKAIELFTQIFNSDCLEVHQPWTAPLGNHVTIKAMPEKTDNPETGNISHGQALGIMCDQPGGSVQKTVSNISKLKM